jgi:hypothetical protein
VLLLLLGEALSEAAAAEADDGRMWLGALKDARCSHQLWFAQGVPAEGPASAAMSKKASAKTGKGFASSINATSRRFARPSGLRGWLAQCAVCCAGRMCTVRFNNPRCCSDYQTLNCVRTRPPALPCMEQVTPRSSGASRNKRMA